MTTLTVRDMMTSPVLSITPSTRLPQIKSLMRARDVRRLPVLDHNRLIGIVTLGDVRNAFPSDATTLSIYELSYLLDNVTAVKIMRRDVITIEAGAPIRAAAQLMLQHKIGGLPVMEDQRVVGMITESDLFRAVIAGSLPTPSVETVVAADEQKRAPTQMIV